MRQKRSPASITGIGLALGCMAALFAALPARAQYTFRNVADSTMLAPGGASTFNFLPNIRANASINKAGVVAFNAVSIYTNDGATTTRVLTFGATAPDSGATNPPFNTIPRTLGTFASFSIGDTGLVVASSVLGSGPGIGIGGSQIVYSGYYSVDASGGPVTRIAATAQPAPDGLYGSMEFGGYTPSVSPTGKVAFWGDQVVSASTTYASGIYVYDGSSTVRISERGDLLPGGGAANLHDEPDMNAAGQVAFYATTTGGPARGVYLYDSVSDSLARLAATGDAAPGGGTLNQVGPVSINDLGEVAFSSTTIGGATSGLYLASGGSLSLISAIGDPQLAGGAGATFWVWKTINDSGQVAFATRTGVGPATLLQGIYVGDGAATLSVVELGDSLFGSTVTQLALGKDAFNDAGQVAFGYTLADGRIGVAVANPAAVGAPEPGSLLLVAVGLTSGRMLIAGRRRGRRRLAPA